MIRLYQIDKALSVFGDLMKKVFIDGSAGTTGLRIFDRLSNRNDIELVVLDDSLRKNDDARRKALNDSDIAFLCLPDDAARQAVSWVENPNTVIIDTSTAHRTLDGWAYGFPELSAAHKEKILNSKRIAVPGCHASGFIALTYPLLQQGLISANAELSCHSLTGYSGGGKKMITDYNDNNRPALLDAPRQYGLTQNHKHLKEMCAVTGLTTAPNFCPIVADFYSGMLVTVPIFASQLNGTVNDIKEVYKNLFRGNIVTYCDGIDESGFLSANAKSGKDTMEVSVTGNDERILLVARYDNLGKGASGAAIQCLNLVLGEDEAKGLSI